MFVAPRAPLVQADLSPGQSCRLRWRLVWSGMGESPQWLSDEEWARISRLVPIACIDVLPVVRSESGQIELVGLILRDGPVDIGRVWTHIGGRLLFGESLSAGVSRSLREVLQGPPDWSVASSPYTVMEYFTDRRTGSGYDPRKHAVTSCFLAESDLHEKVHAVRGSEALDFKWFLISEIPQGVWPGTDIMIDRALGQEHLQSRPPTRWAQPDLTYAALATRETSRDQMMWQSPALAMTAMAFLLTIALGSDGPIWARALSASLSFVVALMSMQLMARHSVLTKKDADILWKIECDNRMLPIHERPMDEPQPSRGRRTKDSLDRFERMLAKPRSRHVWMIGLGLFAVVSLIGLIVTISSGDSIPTPQMPPGSVPAQATP